MKRLKVNQENIQATWEIFHQSMKTKTIQSLSTFVSFLEVEKKYQDKFSDYDPGFKGRKASLTNIPRSFRKVVFKNIQKQIAEFAKNFWRLHLDVEQELRDGIFDRTNLKQLIIIYEYFYLLLFRSDTYFPEHSQQYGELKEEFQEVVMDMNIIFYNERFQKEIIKLCEEEQLNANMFTFPE